MDYLLTRRSFVAALSAIGGNVTSRLFGLALSSGRREYHVSIHGEDSNEGTSKRMLRTISAAATKAAPGDTITVHKGLYRERISPPRGGVSDNHRIVYQAAPGELVELSGAEVVTGWAPVRNGVWKITLANTFFGNFNPYSDILHGDWFHPKQRQLHTGAVYLNGSWLMEAVGLDEVFQAASSVPLWFGQVGDTETTLWAQFEGDPNRQLTEINVRQTVFYPEKPGINYITVRGFVMRQAATPWAPPTAEQKALLGTHWSKGWVIENNHISYSMCAGISLGKYGDEFDNKSGTATGYVQTIERASKRGWSKENIGHHIVRGNTISHCEQAGIVGSLGAIFSSITGNTIHDIYVRRLYDGAEMAGIKIHAAIDVEISRNRIYRGFRGLWLDWMAQGTHVSRNLFYENDEQDLFVEVDHGPFMVENNLFLSHVSQHTLSQGGAYVHNLFCGGTMVTRLDTRLTPFMKAHSTEIVGLHNNPSGDMRFYNNLFVQAGDLSPFNDALLPVHLEGNVFLDGSKPCKDEADPMIVAGSTSDLRFESTQDGCVLSIHLDRTWATRTRMIVTSQRLGNAIIPDLPFEHADGTPFRIDTDYLGNLRDMSNPFPGPFKWEKARMVIPVWPTKGNSSLPDITRKDRRETPEPFREHAN
jgi:alpha-N-arabinofuranosidase